METDLHTLNQKYALPGHVTFMSGPGELTMAVINNQFAQATITLAGGHVMSYMAHGGHPLLWVSPNASYVLGKPMRGGIPVCWPWFGPNPQDPQNLPMHGLVRTLLWSVAGTSALPNGATQLRLEVCDTPETLGKWPHPFRLELIVTVGPRLRLEWVAQNPGTAPYTYTGAFHPYFPVSNIRAIMIRGLEGLDYLDKTDAFKRKTQDGPITITAQTDRIYLDTTAPMQIEDPGFGHTIHIAKGGSHTSVVWNPDTNDEKMPDVGSGQHRFFVCVEAANAVDDQVTVPPGGEGRLAMEIWAA